MIDLVASTGVCSVCRERKSLIDFYASQVTRSGRMYTCKTCTNARSQGRRSHVKRIDRSHLIPDFDLDAPVSYAAAHQRVHYWRGSATIHKCSCGDTAQNWAYRHDSPHEQVAVVSNGFGNFEVHYSPDPMAYDPMCRSCHTRFDSRRKRKENA